MSFTTTHEIYSQIGLLFISRNGVTTNFRINNNATTIQYFDLMLRAICIYTYAIFQTDTHDQMIYFKQHKNYYDTIENALIMFMAQIIEPNCTNEYYYYNENKINDTLCKQYPNSVIKYDIKTTLTKYTVTASVWFDSENYLCDKETCYKHIGKNKFTITQDTDAETEYKFKIIQDSDDHFGESGFCENYGNNINEKTKKKLTTTKIIESGYINIDITKPITINEINNDNYICKFSEYNEINHASFPCGRNCLVEYDVPIKKSISNINLVNSVKIKLTRETEYIYVETTYHAISVL